MLFCLAQFFITSAAYAAFEASSMIEYAMAFYTCVTVAASTIIYMELFLQMRDVLNYVDNCKQFVGSSEYKSFINSSLDIKVNVDGTKSLVSKRNKPSQAEML